MAEVEFDFAVSLEQIEKALARLPDIGEQRAKELTNAVGGELKKLEQQGAKSGKGIGEGLKAGAAGAGALAAGVAAAAAAYKALGDANAATVRQITDFSTRTGLSAETLAGLRLAAQQTGRELDDLVPEDLAVRIKEAAEGTGTGADAFKLLGVAATDASGKLRNGDAVFRDLVDSLSSMQDRTLAAALADDLFSDAGTRLLGVLDKGTGQLDKFVDGARTFGADVGPKGKKAADDWQRATSSLQTALEDTTSDLLEMKIAGQSAASWMSNTALGWVWIKTAVTEGRDAANKAAYEFWALTKATSDGTVATVEGAAAAAAAAGDWGALARGFKATTNAAAGAKVVNQEAAAAAKASAEALAATQAGLDKLGAELQGEYAEVVREKDREIYQSKQQLEREWRREQKRAADEAERQELERQARSADRQLRLYDTIVEKAAEVAPMVSEAFAPWAEAIGNMFTLAQGRAEAASEHLDALKKQNEKIRASMAKTDDARTEASLQLALDANQAQRKAARERLRETRNAARNAWIAEKAANITQAAMNGAVAVTQAYAQLGPIAGSIAAAGVGIMTATQIAMIASTKPPQFHVGGMSPAGVGTQPDERDLRVRRNEPVIVMSERGAGGGGDHVMRALSQGMPLEAQITVVSMLDGREVARSLGKVSTRATAGRRNVHADRG